MGCGKEMRLIEERNGEEEPVMGLKRWIAAGQSRCRV